MKNCECGCHQEAAGDFLPGHDQRLRVALEKKVGGLLQLRQFIYAAEEYFRGSKSESEYLQNVRRLLRQSGRGVAGDA